MFCGCYLFVMNGCYIVVIFRERFFMLCLLIVWCFCLFRCLFVLLLCFLLVVCGGSYEGDKLVL